MWLACLDHEAAIVAKIAVLDNQMRRNTISKLLDALAPAQRQLWGKLQDDTALALWTNSGDSVRAIAFTVADSLLELAILKVGSITDHTRVFIDGNQHCAVFSDFFNLQDSHAGFGDTPCAALMALLAVSR